MSLNAGNFIFYINWMYCHSSSSSFVNQFLPGLCEINVSDPFFDIMNDRLWRIVRIVIIVSTPCILINAF